MSDNEKPGKSPNYIMNMSLAAIAGQVGCLTMVVIFVALFAGLWLDKYLATKPLFTILLMVGSMPVTLYLMFKVVKTATDRIKPDTTNAVKSEEDTNRE